MTERTRPLSPFMHYRWQYTNSLSILHRLTGVFMVLGLMLFVYWLDAVASGPETYARAQLLIASAPVQFGLAAWLWSFFYHLLNGIRHLAWDLGHGFDLHVARISGWLALTGSLVLTAAFWAFVTGRLSAGEL